MDYVQYEEIEMRVLILAKEGNQSAAASPPTAEAMAEYQRFNEELVKAGVELAQDALVAALEQWPTSGVPERPGGWLMATARHRATDLIRRRKTLERKYEELGREVERQQDGRDLDSAMDEDVGDDLLGLIFMACHPVLSKDARVALTLRVLGGLTTEEIARGFLVPVSSIAQRIVRAKRTLAEAHVRFEV